MTGFLDLLDDLAVYEHQAGSVPVTALSIDAMLAQLTAATFIRFKSAAAGRANRFWFCRRDRRDAEAVLIAACATRPGAETLAALARLDRAVCEERTAFVRRTHTGGVMWRACLSPAPVAEEQFQMIPLYQRRRSASSYESGAGSLHC